MNSPLVLGVKFKPPGVNKSFTLARPVVPKSMMQSMMMSYQKPAAISACKIYVFCGQSSSRLLIEGSHFGGQPHHKVRGDDTVANLQIAHSCFV